jgi:hypothetical protein
MTGASVTINRRFRGLAAALCLLVFVGTTSRFLILVIASGFAPFQNDGPLALITSGRSQI